MSIEKVSRKDLGWHWKVGVGMEEQTHARLEEGMETETVTGHRSI